MERFMNYDFNINRILLACLVRSGEGKRVHRNRRGHGLALFLDGDRTITFESGEKLQVTENMVVYFPKGSNYVVKDREQGHCYAINFDLDEAVDFPPFAVKVKNVGNYLESFKSSQRIWGKKTAGYTAKVKSELYQILYQLQREHDLPYGQIGRVRPALEYIHSRYDKERICVAELAALCGMSTAYLRTLFLKGFGLSPIQYINDLKLRRAAELLASGQYGVQQVCAMAGFEDESYFSRTFKKKFGVSPKSYK